MIKKYISEREPPPKIKKLDEVGELIERVVSYKKVSVYNSSNEEEDNQEHIFDLPLAYQTSVETRVCKLLGLSSYKINHFMIAHSLGVRESVRELDVALTVLEVMCYEP